MEWVFLRSPEGEVREIEATADKLAPLMIAGWRQVPPPPAGQKTTPPAQEDKQHGQHQ
jgi:hypothetical protein